jgi:hypothetical protein
VSFGTFDIGAALGANFLGGGRPNGGIPVDGSATSTQGDHVPQSFRVAL